MKSIADILTAAFIDVALSKPRKCGFRRTFGFVFLFLWCCVVFAAILSIFI